MADDSNLAVEEPTTVLADEGTANTDSDASAAADTGNNDNVDAGNTDGGADDSSVGGDTDATGVAGDDSTTAPETYADFNLPEGVEVDSALLSEATPLFKEMGLTQEQAQKLVDLQVKQIEASGQNQADAFNQQLNDWLDQSKTDKDFGGDDFEKNVGIAKAGLDAFGSPELKQLLDNTGLGNHPEVIRMMVKVGKLVQEDNPGNPGNATSKVSDPVALLYPNDRNDKS